jgi:cytochrome P450
MHITLLTSRCNLFTNSGAKHRHAFLDQMIQAAKKGASLSDQELQAEVDTVMLAVS